MLMALLVLVTGATDGIGLETARQLLQQGAQVIVHGRSAEKLARVKAELGGKVETVRADFSKLLEVRAMAADLDARGLQPEVLVNNAGVLTQERQTTADGFELTMEVNHLAPFLLTHLLLAGSSGAKLKRIVNVASQVHAGADLDVEDPGGKSAGRHAGYAAYGASKLANVLFTVELAERLRGRGVTVNSLHPGVIATKLLREGFGMSGGGTPASGARTSVFLATSKEVEGVTGKYFVNSREAATSAAGRDRELARRLYEASAKATGVAPLAAK